MPTAAISPFFRALYARRVGRSVLVCLLFTICLVFSGRTFAQGIERNSIAGEEEADGLAQAQSNQPYNVKLGDVTLRADASMSASFNDNVNIARYGRQADIILEPSGGITANYQITDLNTLSLNLGFSYQDYVFHSQYSTFNVSPGSDLRFNLFVGDVKFSFYDQFYYQQDPIGAGQISNTAKFNRFSNTAGVRADWDLSDFIITADYNHTNFWVFSDPYKYLTYQSDTFSPEFTFKVSPTIETGLMGSVSSVRYDENVQPDQTAVSGGPYLSAQLTQNLSLSAQAGFYYARYGSGTNGGNQTQNATYYANIGLNHRINDFLTESFTAGRETILGITSDYTERIYANYNLGWQATSYINFGLNLWWENLDDSQSSASEKSDRYGVELGATYRVMDHLTLSLGYQYILKTANPSFYDYYQNVATIGLSYYF